MHAVVQDKIMLSGRGSFRWRFKGWKRGLLGVAVALACSTASFGLFWGSVDYCQQEAEAIQEYVDIGLIRITHPKLYIFLGCEKIYSTGQ